MKRFVFPLTLLFLVVLIFSQCKTQKKLTEKLRYSTLKYTSFKYKEVEKVSYIRTSNYDKKGVEIGYTFQHYNYNFIKRETKYFFDENGNKIREHRYKVDGDIGDSLHYQYDNQNNCIKQVYYLSGFKSPDSFTEYVYDSRCNNIGETTYYKDSTIWLQYAFEYNEKNQTVSFTDIIHTQIKTVYELDEFGNAVKEIDYNKSLKKIAVRTVKNQYDKKNNLIELRCFDEDGKEIKRDEMKYDKRGNVIEEKKYASGVLTWKALSEYTYY